MSFHYISEGRFVCNSVVGFIDKSNMDGRLTEVYYFNIGNKYKFDTIKRFLRSADIKYQRGYHLTDYHRDNTRLYFFTIEDVKTYCDWVSEIVMSGISNGIAVNHRFIIDGGYLLTSDNSNICKILYNSVRWGSFSLNFWFTINDTDRCWLTAKMRGINWIKKHINKEFKILKCK